MGTPDMNNVSSIPAQHQQQPEQNAPSSDVCYLPSAPQQSGPPPPPYPVQTIPHAQMYSSPPMLITHAPMPYQGVMIANSFMSPQAALIKDYMTWSIINIFLGGFLLGLIAVLLSSQTRKRKMAGDLQGARSMSTITLVFNIIATVTAFLLMTFLIIYYVAVLSAINSETS